MSLFDYQASEGYTFAFTAIARLREQRKPTVTTKPQKPKPVTDEQLLAVVEELQQEAKGQAEVIAYLQGRIERQESRVAALRDASPFARIFGRSWFTRSAR